MFEGFATADIETSGARTRAAHGGSGPPLLPLLGDPLTHAMRHKGAPRLAGRLTVIAAGLRGCGDFSKPAGGRRPSAYSFRAMMAGAVAEKAAALAGIG